MKLCLILALASLPFFALLSHPILALFGSRYAAATAALFVLGLTTYPYAVKAHYVAIARVRGRMRRAAFLTSVGACLEIGFAAVGGVAFGLTGVASGFLVALLVEAVMFSRTVLGAVRLRRNPWPS